MLRSVRIVRFFYLVSYLITVDNSGMFEQDIENDKPSTLLGRNKMASIQIFNTIAHIFSIMFISTAIIMMFEELLPYQVLIIFTIRLSFLMVIIAR